MDAIILIPAIKTLLKAIPEHKKKAALEALKKLAEKEIKKLLKG